MTTFVATWVLFAAAMLALGVGVIFARRVLRGSCGGLGDDCACSPAEREECRVARPIARKGAGG